MGGMFCVELFKGGEIFAENTCAEVVAGSESEKKLFCTTGAFLSDAFNCCPLKLFNSLPTLPFRLFVKFAKSFVESARFKSLTISLFGWSISPDGCS